MSDFIAADRALEPERFDSGQVQLFHTGSRSDNLWLRLLPLLVRPQPGSGYDERRYVQYWGTLEPNPERGGYRFAPGPSQARDEEDVPFFEYSERNVPQAMRYMERLPDWLAIPPRVAIEECLASAEAIDQLVGSLDAETISRLVLEGRERLVDRSIHRREHLAAIEGAFPPP